MKNIKLTIAYDGTDFCGWQRQKDAPTIQGEIEKRLSILSNGPVALHGAGRTDSGVHALAMVANFQTESSLPLIKFHNALNSILTRAIRILAAEEVDPEFHARFSSLGKTYLYNVDTASIQFPRDRLYAVHIPQNLALPEMEQCLRLICGTHDFASFEAAGSRDTSITTGRGSVRTLHKATLTRTGKNGLQFEFTGDGFLRHMVRNIVGTVLTVGRGRATVEEFQEILDARDRSWAGVTAPPHGLFLKEIYYA